MASNTKWAVVFGAMLVFLGLGGAFVWQDQHPHVSAIAGLTQMLPPAVQPSHPEPSPALPPAPPTAAAMTPDTAPKRVETPGASPVAPPAKIETPHFDVVRVEPKGDTVVAGKGAPNADVALLASGKVVAQAKADPSGQFVLLPPPLAPGDYDLTLRQTPDGKSATASTQNVTVSIPKAPGGDVVVALTEPGQPTKVLAAPKQHDEDRDSSAGRAPAQPGPSGAAASPPSSSAAAPSPAADRKLSIGAVDLENGTGFHASGSAPPGTTVHVYLNNSRLADVIAGKDGTWNVTIRKGLAGGHYAVRADVTGSGQTVTARAEVPFDVPVAMALPPASTVSPGDTKVPSSGRTATMETARPSAAAETPSTAPDASTAVIDQVVTHQVSNGDNLWTISRHSFGDGRRFTQIYEANAAQIRDPNLIYPGQIFVMPSK